MKSDTRLHNRTLLRAGSLAAVGGVVVALVSTVIDPGLPDEPEQAILEASKSHLLTFDRLLDAAAFLLLLIAVSVVTQTFSSERARGWARVSLALFIVSAGAGAIATTVVGSLPDVADAWAEAPAALKAGYVASFDALNDASGGIFAVSWVALALFGLVFAQAISCEETYPHWVAWVSAVSGALIAGALILGVAFRVGIAFVLLLLGLALSYVVITAIGVRLWRVETMHT